MKLRNFANTDSPEFPPTVHLLSTPRSIHLTHFPSLVHTHTLCCCCLFLTAPLCVAVAEFREDTHCGFTARRGFPPTKTTSLSAVLHPERQASTRVRVFARVCVCVPARRAPEKKNQFNQMSQYLDHPLEAGPPRTPNTQQRRVKTKAGRKVLRD